MPFCSIFAKVQKKFDHQQHFFDPGKTELMGFDEMLKS